MPEPRALPNVDWKRYTEDLGALPPGPDMLDSWISFVHPLLWVKTESCRYYVLSLERWDSVDNIVA